MCFPAFTSSQHYRTSGLENGQMDETNQAKKNKKLNIYAE